jgi:hypothetical protein
MEIFDRYFHMLRLFLPKDQRDDIVRELSEEIRSQVTDKEAELGRPLSQAEQVALIRQYGHPILIAARYRPQRYLIGPVVFPYYLLALKILAAVVFAVSIVASVMAMLVPDARGIEFVVGDLVGNLLRVVGWTTVMAAVIDVWLTRSRVLDRWDPASLLNEPPGPRSKPASIGHFVLGMILSAWWLVGLKYPQFFFGIGANVDFGPIVDRFYPVLFVTQLTLLAEQFMAIVRPHSAFRRFARIIWLVSGWALLVLLFTAPDWEWFARLGPLGEETPVIGVLNRGISIGVLVLVAISLLSGAHRLWRRFAIAPAGART